MDLFDLSAKISLDSSDYDRSLQNASSAAEKWATKFVMAGKAVSSVFAGIGKLAFGLSKQAVDAFSQYEQLAGGIETLFGTNGKSFDEWKKSFAESKDGMQDYADIARKVINGDFGVGAERKDLLAAAGYDPATVQQMVNNLINGVDVASGVSADTISANMQSAEEKYESLERAQDKVIANAQKAFATTGMSANEYITNVTGFSASLINSLGGDTEKAADMADMAMRDIADNANTYGQYSAEELAGVYQSLAKGQYNMLDNLNLGFGGSQKGMQALIDKANQLAKAQGEAGDLQIGSYADIVKAIHLVQTEMNISGLSAEEAAEAVKNGTMTEEEAYLAMGKTAKEASTTIEGSFTSMKAAWKNVLTSLVTGGDFFDQSIQGLVTSVTNFARNIMPAFTGAFRGISALIQDLAPVIVSELPGLVEELVPGFIDAFITIFSTLADELPAIVEVIINVLPSVMEKVADAIVDAAPNIISGLVKLAGVIVKNLPKIFSKVIKGIPKIFSQAFSELGSVFPDIGQWLKNSINKIFGDGSFLSDLFSGFSGAFEDMDWGTIGESILKGITSVLDLGGQFLFDIFNPAKNRVARDVKWGDVGKAVENGLQSVLEGGGQIVSGLGSAVSSAAQKINWDAVGAVIAGCINGMAETAGKLIDTVNWGNIGTTVGDAINGVWTAASSAVNSVKWDLLGATAGATINGIATTANSFITGVQWETIGTNAAGYINGVSTTIGAAISGVQWETIGQTFADGVNAVFSTADSFLTKTDWELIGKNAADAVNGVSTSVNSALNNTDWELIGTTFANSVNGIFESANSFVTETDWELLGKNAADAVNGAATAVNSAINGTNWGLIGAVFSEKINSVFTTVDNFFDTVDWSGIGATAAGAVNDAVTAIKSAIDEIDAEGIGKMLGERINGIFENANTFLQTGENLSSGFLNFGLGISEGAKQLGTDAGNKVGGWLGGLLGGGSEETEESPIADLPEVDSETVASYQQLAEAITSINQAISGGGEETEEGTGGGLTAALAGMPALFDNVLAAAKNLAAYLSGDFIAAITTLLNALCITSEDEEGNVSAGGGNTLFNAMGEIYGLFSNTLGTSKDLGAYWQGEFIEAINALKKGIGPAIGVLLTMAGVAAGAAGQFERLAAAINAVADAYNALKSGGGSGDDGEGGGVDGARASGGAVSANSSYLVGERGPELFTPTRSGYIKPNDTLGGKETVINVTFAGDVIGDEKSISAFVKRAVKRGIREEVYAGA